MKFSLALLIVAVFSAAQAGFLTSGLNGVGAIIKGADKVQSGVAAAGSTLGIGRDSSAATSSGGSASSGSAGATPAGSAGATPAGSAAATAAGSASATAAASAGGSDETSAEESTTGGLAGLVGKVNSGISTSAGSALDLAANVAGKGTQAWNKGVSTLTEGAQGILGTGQQHIKEFQNKADAVPILGSIIKPALSVGSAKIGLVSSVIGAAGTAEKTKMNLINAGAQGVLGGGKAGVNAITSLGTNLAAGLGGALSGSSSAASKGSATGGSKGFGFGFGLGR